MGSFAKLLVFFMKGDFYCGKCIFIAHNGVSLHSFRPWFHFYESLSEPPCKRTQSSALFLSHVMRCMGLTKNLLDIVKSFCCPDEYKITPVWWTCVINVCRVFLMPSYIFFCSPFSVAAGKSETLFGEKILQALPDVLESLQSVCRLLFPRWTFAQITRNTHGGWGKH